MDTIITIIIFLVIFLSAMKNLQEVNRKSREVKLPPQKQSEAHPREQATETSPQPARDWIPTPSEPLPWPTPEWPQKPVFEEAAPERPRRSMEEVFGRLEEKYRPIAERSISEDVTQEDIFEKKKEEAVPFIKYRKPERGSSGIPPRKLALAFNAQAVVNGIIMQEILSPPVGLRRQGGLYW